jgi:signal transduction histidine kinase
MVTSTYGGKEPVIIHIPNDVLQTTFYFSALNYADPSRTAYAYQIKELNKSWIDLGNENSVSIMGLQPGRYTLLVKSANQDGVWNKEPVVVSLHYLPKWYQTLLFKILVIGAIAALLYSFYAYRISQLKKQQKIRKDISADLHDDIGSILEGVKIFTHLAKKEPHQQAHLKRIEESITQASTGFRDIIWILDDKQDTCYQFMERIKKLALPIANANDIQLHCSVEDGLNERTLSKIEKRHLLMIVKESINNSIKYSGCKNIKVAIRLIQNKLAVMIVDDGRGFDAKAASEGNGLKNIVYRAGQIGFQAEISSSPGEGCVVKVVRR